MVDGSEYGGRDLQTSTVLDFLYADHEKVASILSQIDEHAAPRTTAVRGQRSNDGKAVVGAKVFGFGGDLSSGRGTQYEVRQEYDPLWVNSRRLVKQLESSSNSEPAHIGQLRIIEGHLIAFDQSVLSKVMSASSMLEFIAAGMLGPDSVKRSQKIINEKKKEAEVVKTYISTLGLSISFIMVSQLGGFWFNINKEYLYLHELDVPLKFPVVVSGRWKAAGIVDAMPNDQFELGHIDSTCKGEHIPVIMSNLGELIGATSLSFGRRSDSYGLKPLAIFREVSF